MPHYSGGFLYNPRTSEVLLHKRDANAPVNPDAWAFFGGNSEAEETPIETFIREIREELGIDIEESSVVTLREYYNPDFRIMRYVFVVLSEREKSEMTLGEGEGFDWVPLERSFAMKLTKRTQEDLSYFRDALAEGSLDLSTASPD